MSTCIHLIPTPGADLEPILVAAGWHPGRRVPELVSAWRAALAASDGLELHAAAEAALLTYGGLHIRSHGPGRDLARADLHLDPALARGEGHRFRDYFPELRGRDVFPLGEVAGGQAFLGVARDGVTYLLGDEVFARWPSVDAALQGVLLGHRGADI